MLPDAIGQGWVTGRKVSSSLRHGMAAVPDPQLERHFPSLVCECCSSIADGLTLPVFTFLRRKIRRLLAEQPFDQVRTQGVDFQLVTMGRNSRHVRLRNQIDSRAIEKNGSVFANEVYNSQDMI